MTLKDIEHRDLSEVISSMRRLGIVHLAWVGGALTIGDAPRQESIHVDRDAPIGEEEKLQICGHALWEMNDEGLCYHGCSPVKEEE